MAEPVPTYIPDVTWEFMGETPEGTYLHALRNSRGDETLVDNDQTEQDVLDYFGNLGAEKLENTRQYEYWTKKFELLAGGGGRGIGARVFGPNIRNIPPKVAGLPADIVSIIADYGVGDPIELGMKLWGWYTGEKPEALQQYQAHRKTVAEQYRAGEMPFVPLPPGSEVNIQKWQNMWLAGDEWLKSQGQEPYLQKYLGTEMTPDARTSFERMVSLALDLGLTAPIEAVTGAGILKGGATLINALLGLGPEAVKSMAKAAKGGESAKLLKHPDKFSEWLSDSVDAYTTFTRPIIDPDTGAVLGRKMALASPAVRMAGAEAAFGFSAGAMTSQAMDYLNEVNPGATPWVNELLALGAGLIGPPTLALGITGLLTTPGIKSLKVAAEPLITPATSATRFLASPKFGYDPDLGMGEGKREYWKIRKGVSKTKRARMMTVAEMLDIAKQAGRFKDADAGLQFTTPEVLRTEALILDGDNILIEEAIFKLRQKLDAGEIDAKTFATDREAFASQMSQNKDNQLTARTYANFIESVLTHAYKDPSTIGVFYTTEARRLSDRADRILKKLVTTFEDDVRSIDFGGKKGEFSPVEIEDDYLRAVNQGVPPELEVNRRRLITEKSPMGIERSEMAFLNGNTRERWESALQKQRNSQEEIVLESVASAERRIEEFRKGLANQLSRRDLKSVNDLGSYEKKLVGQYIRDTYDDVHREFQSYSRIMWNRVEGLDLPTTNELLVFPKDARDASGKDISGMSVEDYAAQRAKYIVENRADLQYSGLTPRAIKQVAGQQALIDIAKLAEETGPTPRDRAKIETLEARKIAAEESLVAAQKTFDDRIASQNTKAQELTQDLTTYLDQFDVAYANRQGIQGTNLLRHFVNDPDINWETMTKADLDTYLDALREKVGGIKIQPGEHLKGTDNYSNLVAIIGDRAALDISNGVYSPGHAIGVQIAALQAKPSKYQKAIANPFDNILKKQKDLTKILGFEGPVHKQLTNLDEKLEAAQRNVEGATSNLETAIQKYMGMDEKAVPAELDVDPLDLGPPPSIGRLTPTADRPITPAHVRAVLSEFSDAIRRESAKPNPRQPYIAALAEERDVFQQLLHPDNFPQLNATSLANAVAGTELLKRVEGGEGAVLLRTARGEPKVWAGLLASEVVKGAGAGAIPDVEKVRAQMQALVKSKLATMQLPERWLTFREWKNPDTGRIELVPKLNEEVFANIAKGQTFLDLPDSPFKRQDIGTHGITKWSITLKEDAVPTKAGLDVVEAGLLESLYVTLADPSYVSETALRDFYKSYRGPIQYLVRGGRTELAKSFEDVKKAEILVGDIKQALKDKDRAALTNMKENNTLPESFDVDSYLDFEEIQKVRLAAHQELQGRLGKVFAGSSPGQGGVEFLRSIMKEGEDATTRTREALKVVGPKQELKGPLTEELAPNLARDGFEASIIAAIFSESTVRSPLAQRQLGTRIATIFDPQKFEEIIKNPNVEDMLRETFNDNLYLITGLREMAAGIDDISPFLGRNAPAISPGQMNEYVSDMMWANLGRMAALAGAKLIGFVNELVAAGIGGQVFRRIGRNVTGNVIKSMVIEAAINPEIALAFMQDAAKLDGLGAKFRTYASENLNVPRAVMNRAKKTPFAFMDLITAVESGMGFAVPPQEEGIPEGYELRDGPEGFGAYPKTSAIMPSPSNINVASTLNRIRPLAPAQVAAAGPPQVAAAGPPQVAAAGPPDAQARLQQYANFGMPMFGHEGGLASLQKKPRQMVH